MTAGEIAIEYVPCPRCNAKPGNRCRTTKHRTKGVTSPRRVGSPTPTHQGRLRGVLEAYAAGHQEGRAHHD